MSAWLRPSGPACSRSSRSARALVFYVRDESAGFDRARVSELRSVPREGDPAHCFGLLLAKMVVDEMMYSERGNEVVLVKHRW
jgi:hypothetical protein